MKLFLSALLFAVCPLTVWGQSGKTPVPSHPNNPASQEIQTETIGPAGKTTTAAPAPARPSGLMEPAQVKALMHKVWLAQFRLSDLLTQVHPEKWKMDPAARQSFDQSLDALRKAIAAEEAWRGQCETRPDSLYLAFQTYLAIGALLPRVDGVSHSVSQYVNPSFGAQYSQSANQLFDLQQLIEPHLEYLLKNQDDYLLAVQTNVSSCENQLNYAMAGKQAPAVMMKNIAPDFKGRRRSAHAATPGSDTGKAAAPANSGKPGAPAKPAEKAPAKPDSKSPQKK